MKTKQPPKATVKRVSFNLKTTDSRKRVKEYYRSRRQIYYDEAGRMIRWQAIEAEDVGER